MTNRLIHETSPYLLQHAQNPVDWFPWGEEAFAKARNENIGYAACHWCHVMEHESFEDGPIAAKMNELFVSIKVDREERPDVDSIYMQALMTMQGQGGWPLNVFLMPDGRPFCPLGRACSMQSLMPFRTGCRWLSRTPVRSLKPYVILLLLNLPTSPSNLR